MLRADRGRRALAAAAIALSLGTYVALARATALAKSSTYDEVPYLIAGMRLWRAGDVTDEVHGGYGPLGPLLVTAPLRALELMNRESVPEGPDELAGFMRLEEARLLPAARAVVTALGTGLLLLVALVAWRERGPLAAAVATLLAASSPDLLAHGSLATHDLPVAAFTFGAVVAFVAWLRTGRRRWLIPFALALGAGAATKHSALPFMALGTAATLACLAARPRAFASSSALAERFEAGWPAVARAFGALLVAGLAALVLAALAFGFSDGRPNMVASLQSQLAHVSRGHPSYFLGEIGPKGGFHGYFVVAPLLKWPLPLLGLAATGALARRRGPGRLRLLALGAPAVALLALLSLGGLDLGVRYLLPALPCALLLATDGALALARTKGGKLVAVALVSWQVLGALATHPDHLAFFNELAGGTRGGARYLAESNLDWGQDMPALRDWTREHQVERLSIAYPLAAPEAYGLRDAGFVFDEDGIPHPVAPVFAVSQNLLLGLGRPGWRSFSRLSPVAVLHGTVFVYDLRRPGP
jgi:hypothetical protein